MSRQAQLQGVANNTMDHAVSGLGYLNEHVVQYCTTSGLQQVRLNLLPPGAVSADLSLPKPLRFAAEACQGRFVYILMHAGFQLTDVTVAHLEYELLGDSLASPFTCACSLQSARGRRYVGKMNSTTYWLRKKDDPVAVMRQLGIFQKLGRDRS